MFSYNAQIKDIKTVYDNQFFYVIVTSSITITLAFLMTKYMEISSKLI
jgi:hypothetical protein